MVASPTSMSSSPIMASQSTGTCNCRGNVTADVADADLFNAVSLGPQDILEPIDYSIVSKDKTLPQYALEHGVSIILYGYAFVYDTQTSTVKKTAINSVVSLDKAWVTTPRPNDSTK